MKTPEEWISEAEHALPLEPKLSKEIVSAIQNDARHSERIECWQAINAQIKQGNLPGHGIDESAQRNGLVLASNIISMRSRASE